MDRLTPIAFCEFRLWLPLIDFAAFARKAALELAANGFLQQCRKQYADEWVFQAHCYRSITPVYSPELPQLLTT